jgi:anaerobic ribonucleoside-triphosphate reductase activating protein
MYYSAYHSIDVINGEGTRCTLFVSGCEHACKGCYNQSTWRVDAGHVFSQALEDQIINDLTEAILKLVMRVKDECPEKDIWLWTGYQLADLSAQQQTVVNLVDVMIDGKFEQDKADPALLWRGSSNQQVYRFNR